MSSRVTDWRSTEDEWSGWSFPGSGAGTGSGVAVSDFSMLAVCAGNCPWVGAVVGLCGLPNCPVLCRGCAAGWAFDGAGRHIGPAPYPASNRWDCNHLKWTGRTP